MDKKTRHIIFRTVSSWADGVGIISMASQEKLFKALIANLEAAEQSAEPTPSKTPPDYHKGDWAGKVFLGSE